MLLPIWLLGKELRVVDSDNNFNIEGALDYLFTNHVLGKGQSVYSGNVDRVIPYDMVDQVIQVFKDKGAVLVKANLHGGVFVGNNFYAQLDAGRYPWVYTDSIELRDEFLKALKAVIPERPPLGTIFTLASSRGGGLRLIQLGNTHVPFERGNYSDEVVKDIDRIVNDLNSKTPSGRLAVLDGEPGTGKTTCLRGVVAQVPKARFVVIPSHLVAQLADPSFIELFLQDVSPGYDEPETERSTTTVLLVEDADSLLMKRDANNVSQVSTLLNLGDGIVGAALDIRIVCTTNLQDNEMDPAVLRPGRLSRKVHVGKLSAKKAAEVAKRLSGKDVVFDGSMTLAEVYALANDPEWVPVVKKERRVGFGA